MSLEDSRLDEKVDAAFAAWWPDWCGVFANEIQGKHIFREVFLGGVQIRNAEVAELRRKVFMSGTWKRDTCGFEQNNRTLNVHTGDVGVPVIEEIPICPNKDGQPMRRVTWEECAASNYEAAQRFLDERDAAFKLAGVLSPFTLIAADAIAKLIDEMGKAGKLDSRSPLADARLQYGEPFKYEYTKPPTP